MAGTDGTLLGLGYEQLTGISASKALQNIPAGATIALLQATGQDVNYTDDATTPTTTLGMTLIAGNDPIKYFGDDLSQLLFIETQATGKVNISYYRG